MTIGVAGDLLGIPLVRWLELLVAWSIKGTVLLLLGLIGHALLGQRSAALKSWIWLVVFLGLVSLPIADLALDSASVPQRYPVGPLVALFDPGDLIAQEIPVATRTSVPKEISPLPGPSRPTPPRAFVPPVSTTPDSPRSVPTWPAFLVLIWLAGVIQRGTNLLHAVGAGWLAARSSYPLTHTGILAEGQRAQLELGCRLPVAVRLHPTELVPFVTGLWRPVLILPRGAVDWDPSVRRATFLHEFAHLKRMDLPRTCLIQMACTLLWFHPLIWWGARLALLEMEKACDDCVLWHGTSARVYATHLLRCAAVLSRNRRPLAPVQSLAERSHLPERIIMILDAKTKRDPLHRNSSYLMAGVIALLVLFLAALPLIAEVEPSRAASTTQSRKPTGVPLAAYGGGSVDRLVADRTGGLEAVSTAESPREALAELAGGSAGTRTDVEPDEMEESGRESRVIRADDDFRREIQAILAEMRAVRASDQPDETKLHEISRRLLTKLTEQLRKKYKTIGTYVAEGDSNYLEVAVSIERIRFEADGVLTIKLSITQNGEETFTIFLPKLPETEEEQEPVK